MAESTLSITYRTLQQEVAYYIGWGTDATVWTADQLATINLIVKSGLRQFYTPPRLPTQTRPHRWSFLKPVERLTTVAPYSTGTVAVTNGDATVTLTDGTWPTWAAEGTLLIAGVAYDVASRTGDDEIELTSAWSGTTASDFTYSLERRSYDLPDNFGSIIGDMTFEETSGVVHSVPIIGESQVRFMQQQNVGPATPQVAAVRPKSHAGTETTGQRWQLLLHPAADEALVLAYRCRLNTESFNEAAPSTTYPPGGSAHSETLIASCVAAAESRINDAKGPKWERFLERLEASIEVDLEQVPETWGKNTNNGGRMSPPVNRTPYATRNGVLYDGSE